MAVNAILISDFTDTRFCAAFRLYFAESGIHISDWDNLFREMNEDKTNLAYLLPDDSGNMIGFIFFQVSDFSNWFFKEPVGFIREFWIAPAHRRQGHGTLLLSLAETYFTTHGAYRSILTADDAVEFYLANGYQNAPGIKAKNKMEVLFKSLL